jgi:GR25 family glycosyltransferase involved in LPS biosynthesis
MIDVFLINLTRRNDRLIMAVNELSKVHSNIIRVEAVDAQAYNGEGSVFVSKAAFVCSLSHKKALEEFIGSGKPYGIVVEDDLKIRSTTDFDKAHEVARKFKIDLLQIGYLTNGLSDSIDLLIVNLVNTIIKLFNVLPRKFGFNTFAKQRFQRNYDLPMSLIPDNFRAGAHCYLISRTLAIELVNVIEGSNNTYDGLLMSISLHRKFKVVRLLKSAVSQRETESDIKKRD